MAEFPKLPLWTDALIGDTYHLTPAQFGAYLRLLIVAWRRKGCDLPNDDVELGRYVGDPQKADAKQKRNRSQLPEGFPPKELLHDAAQFLGAHGRIDLANDIRAQVDQFRDHHLGHGTLAADWPATWRTWYRNALKFNRKANGNGHRESPHEQTERICRELARQSQACDETPDFGTDRRARIALPSFLANDE